MPSSNCRHGRAGGDDQTAPSGHAVLAVGKKLQMPVLIAVELVLANSEPRTGE